MSERQERASTGKKLATGDTVPVAPPCGHQVVERRHDQALGEIAAGRWRNGARASPT